MSHTAETHEQKVSKYFKVFWALFAITLMEVGVVYTKMPKAVISSIVMLLACTKAAAVGYYYMHLEHETKWLRYVALLPLIAFAYAVLLIVDTPSRPSSAYHPDNPRVMREYDVGSAEESEHAEGEAAAPGEHAEAKAVVLGHEMVPSEVKVREVTVNSGNPAAALKENEEAANAAAATAAKNAQESKSAPPAGVPTAPSGASAPAAAGGDSEWK